MSRAGDFVRLCGEKGVQIEVVNKRVALRGGCMTDVAALNRVLPSVEGEVLQIARAYTAAERPRSFRKFC